MSQSIECVIMRGGTSKAVFLKDEDLPADTAQREQLILRVFGSPDQRQIDGLGGADPLTSKLAIIGKPGPELKDRADVVYTFGQVGIREASIDWHSLCGNISSAVGLYCVQEGLVPLAEPVTTVRVFNTNLRRMLRVDVPVQDGMPCPRGDYTVPGVPGTGARIDVDFAETAGSSTGALLPTGNPMDEVEVPGMGAVPMTLIDTGNAHVFVKASDIGLHGAESVSEIDADPALLVRLEAIRDAGAVRMGMASAIGRARVESPATPILGVVAPPVDYTAELTGERIKADDVDFVSRLQFMQQSHKTYAGTSTACSGVAARLEGTLVNQVARRISDETVRIGHPAGVIETEAVVEAKGRALYVRRATLGRTARRILEGRVYIDILGEAEA